jgi:hypothetical protein
MGDGAGGTHPWVTETVRKRLKVLGLQTELTGKKGVTSGEKVKRRREGGSVKREIRDAVGD